MLKSCSYCGRIHPKGYVCPQKPVVSKRQSAQNDIRNTWAWHKTRDAVKERDHYLCRVCLGERRITYDDLEAHHITPLEEDVSRALDEDWIITVCRGCHERAERGEISREYLHRLALTPIEGIPPG